MRHPRSTSLLLAAFLAPGVGFSQSAAVKHFWDFEGSSYNDKVGTAHGSVTAGSLDTDGSAVTYPGAGPVADVGHGGADSSVAFGIYQTPIDDANHNYVAIDPTGLYQPGTDSFSFTYWIKIPNDGETYARGIFDFGGDPSDGTGAAADGVQSLFARNGGNLIVRVDGVGAGNAIANYSGSGLDDNAWHFVAVTYQPGGTLDVHVDGYGVDASATAMATTVAVPLNQKSYLGAYNLKAAVSAADTNNDRNGMNGNIDDVAIYSGILTEAQINALYAGTLSPSSIVFTPPPAAAIGHYWDFDTLNPSFLPMDRQGDLDLTDIAPNYADFGVDPLYGSAFSGAGGSLNMQISDINYLTADTWDETNSVPLALDFGANDFAISYWVWDSSNVGNGDADVRTACVLDCLNGSETGVQISSTAEGYVNLRLDDDAGNSFVSGANALVMPADQWVHVSINIDRAANLAKIFFNGSEVGSYDISVLTGNIACSQDLQIGVINGGGTAGQAQQCGIDDLAIYPRTLSAGEIAALADATTTPLVVLSAGPISAPGPASLVSYNRNAGTGESTIVWESEIGVTYSVWGSPDLETWTELTPPGGVAGTGSNLDFMDTPAGPPNAYFYQVRSE